MFNLKKILVRALGCSSSTSNVEKNDDEDKVHLVYDNSLLLHPVQSQLNIKNSSSDVHICNSFLCTECSDRRLGFGSPDPKASVQFIKVEQTPKKDNKPSLNADKGQQKKHTPKLIIENISSVKVGGSTVNKKQVDNKNELAIKETESLSYSDDESVEAFIESIEGGQRASF